MYNTGTKILGESIIAQTIYTDNQIYKIKRTVKKYLKIVVKFSNIIQDEKNKLQDMINANFSQQDINEQYNYVIRLISKQNNAINDLIFVENQYPEGINERFFYFKEKGIFDN